MNTVTLEQGDRRCLTHAPFEASVSILSPYGKWYGKLIDISLKGALISRPQSWVAKPGDKFLLDMHQPDAIFSIRMEVEVAHSTDDNVGLQCEHIDIDSTSHLRRLVELNRGNEATLYRELSAMGH